MASLFQKSGAPIQTSPTTATPGYIGNLENTAKGYVGGNFYGGPNQNITDAMGAWRAAMNMGNQGLAALTNPGAASQFMSPYLAQMDPLFDRFRQQAQTGAMDEATLGGGGSAAFDNSRAAAMRGSALAGVDQSQAQFNYQAFNDAMQRAFGVAGMGMGAANSLFQGGQYQDAAQQLWQQRQLGLLQQGMGPTGTAQSTNYSPLLQLAGLGMMPFGGGNGILGLMNQQHPYPGQG